MLCIYWYFINTVCWYIFCSQKEATEHINLKVVGQDGQIVNFKIKTHTALKKLMSAYCARSKLAQSTVRCVQKLTSWTVIFQQVPKSPFFNRWSLEISIVLFVAVKNYSFFRGCLVLEALLICYSILFIFKLLVWYPVKSNVENGAVCHSIYGHVFC